MSDLIRRQGMCDSLNKFRLEKMQEGKDVSLVWECIDKVLQEPSAETERKAGRWLRAGTWHDNQIWECSKCDSAVLHDGAGQWNYCPVCGSRNEVEHD